MSLEGPIRDGHRPQLDGLRAVAVLLVFVHHWTKVGGGLGMLGVQLFFVMSGFLITSILLRLRDTVARKEQSIGFSLRQFYVRRGLRIWPLYYVCLLLFAAMDRFEIRQSLKWHLCQLSNVYFFRRGEFWGPLSHFWSLAVEEQFYLFWPGIVLLVSRRRLALVLICLIVAAPLTRFLTFLAGYSQFVQTNTLVWANLDTLGMGGLLAHLRDQPITVQHRIANWNKVILPICVLEVAVARLFPSKYLVLLVDPVAIALLAAWLVQEGAKGFGGVSGALLSHPLVTHLGRISYGLYVWHMFAPAFLRNILSALRLPEHLNRGFSGFCLLFAFTWGLASLSWLAVERPINSLKRFFPYQRGVPSGAEVVAQTAVSR